MAFWLAKGNSWVALLQAVPYTLGDKYLQKLNLSCKTKQTVQ